MKRSKIPHPKGVINSALRRSLTPFQLGRQKIDLIQRCLPVESVADFGGTWGVDAGYAVKCATDFQVRRVFLIDEVRPKIDLPKNITFIQGDFTSELILEQVPKVDLVLAFDIILHQYGPLRILHAMLEKSNKYIAIHQPTIKEDFLKHESEMLFLPGITDGKTCRLVHPGPKVVGVPYSKGFFNPITFNTNYWLWGIPKHLMRVWVEARDFEIVFENVEEINKVWCRWGFVAQRK